MGRGRRAWIAWALLATVAHAQAPAIDRPGPPSREDFETDADGDGVPDGWYNLRDARLVRGGPVGPTSLRFDNARPGRQARASRAFGVDGRETEALIVGLWVRVEKAQSGERIGEEAGLLIDFLGEELRTEGRGTLGPWTDDLGRGWVRVARRIAVPQGTRDVILTLGLLGATGTLEVDGLTIETVPVGGARTVDLLRNGGFERGDPSPEAWSLEQGARRTFPGRRSNVALELAGSGARALTDLGLIDRHSALVVSLAARGSGLRGAGGGLATVFFLDPDGRPLPGHDAQARLFRWSGTFDWRADRSEVLVPPNATRAVLQIEKTDPAGWLRIDDVAAVPTEETARLWVPYHVNDRTDTWKPFPAATQIAADSALDASHLLEGPAGRHGFVTVRDGRLHFTRGGRARFFGVALLPPLAFPEPDRADALADRLARSGVNLVRFDSLDAPIGPGVSLFDDARDDTRTLDPVALAKFDHLVAVLKRRGIYIALELQQARRFRQGDGVAGGSGLPPGGGPAVGFDPTIRRLTLEAAKALLGHVNPETGLSLRDDPVLAWFVLAGEHSAFDLNDDPDALPAESSAVLREEAQKRNLVAGRKGWRAIELAQWKALADDLRAFDLKVPIAGPSHWRREPSEFLSTLVAPGLDLIDDRLYWSPPSFVAAERRSLLFDPNGGLAPLAMRKRRADRPYVVGQWCARTGGVWALPFEGADLMLASWTAAVEDWDALVRRGVAAHPEVWGAAATGTGGGLDVFPVPEAINGIPPVFALLPHAASLVLRGVDDETSAPSSPRLLGWDARRGRLVIDTPHTQAVAGRTGGEPAAFERLTIEVDTPGAVVAVSSLGPEPIAQARRLLVTAIGRAQPTGLTWADESRREVADPGRPPLRKEPVRGSVTWNGGGTVRAFPLDATGQRSGTIESGPKLAFDGRTDTVHWELIVESGP